MDDWIWATGNICSAMITKTLHRRTLARETTALDTSKRDLEPSLTVLSCLNPHRHSKSLRLVCCTTSTSGGPASARARLYDVWSVCRTRGRRRSSSRRDARTALPRWSCGRPTPCFSCGKHPVSRLGTACWR